jgi:hypothetical protein
LISAECACRLLLRSSFPVGGGSHVALETAGTASAAGATASQEGFAGDSAEVAAPAAAAPEAVPVLGAHLIEDGPVTEHGPGELVAVVDGGFGSWHVLLLYLGPLLYLCGRAVPLACRADK